MIGSHEAWRWYASSNSSKSLQVMTCDWSRASRKEGMRERSRWERTASSSSWAYLRWERRQEQVRVSPPCRLSMGRVSASWTQMQLEWLEVTRNRLQYLTVPRNATSNACTSPAIDPLWISSMRSESEASCTLQKTLRVWVLRRQARGTAKRYWWETSSWMLLQTQSRLLIFWAIWRSQACPCGSPGCSIWQTYSMPFSLITYSSACLWKRCQLLKPAASFATRLRQCSTNRQQISARCSAPSASTHLASHSRSTSLSVSLSLSSLPLERERVCSCRGRLCWLRMWDFLVLGAGCMVSLRWMSRSSRWACLSGRSLLQKRSGVEVRSLGVRSSLLVGFLWMSLTRSLLIPRNCWSVRFLMVAMLSSLGSSVLRFLSIRSISERRGLGWTRLGTSSATVGELRAMPSWRWLLCTPCSTVLMISSILIDSADSFSFSWAGAPTLRRAREAVSGWPPGRSMLCGSSICSEFAGSCLCSGEGGGWTSSG